MKGSRINRQIFYIFLGILYSLLSFSALAQDVKTELIDLNGDGINEVLTTSHDGGSGYSTSQLCIQEGKSKDKACRSFKRTSYSRFEGIFLEADPPYNNKAKALLPPFICEKLGYKDPKQASLQVWNHDHTSTEESFPSQPWFSGLPLSQVNVCLERYEATSFSNSFIWNAQGEKQGYQSCTDCLIRYVAEWTSKDPLEVLANDLYVIYQWGNALAVFDRTKNQHSWLVNMEDGSQDNFKVDRWKRFKNFEWINKNKFSFQALGFNHGSLKIVMNLNTPPAWTSQYDFDGDKVKDDIGVSFSGGAHCCYQLDITLSSNKKTYKLPFEMDGGYPEGLNLDVPSHFNIKDYDGDGYPEIYMEIQTYTYHIEPIPQEWTKKYGFKTNHILIDFKKGRLKVKDVDKALLETINPLLEFKFDP